MAPVFRESRNTVPNRIIGYARVSTSGQTIEQQVDALRAIGVAAVFADEGVSGAQRDRDGLSAALAELQPGDALAVVALDRLGRDLSDLVRVVDGLRDRGAHLRSLRESIDTTTAAGRMLFGIFGALSEYERAMIQERTLERLAAKKRRGERVGRRPVLTPSQIALARRELAAGAGSAGTIARNLRVGRSTLYRALSAGTI
jgi:DNA invertase Pin-like site-specific DNA recombinase